MSEAELFESIVNVAADVLGVSPAKLTPQSTPDDIAAWDSITHLSLILAIEQSLDVTFDPDRIAELTSIQMIANEVRSLQN